ncbi:hypothetical protein ACWEXK_12205 [Staphylococcus xylosus]|uniref:hypothetical protein n=1 Tax=Staphylococcus xylosus TaxID=1288 RepID=UPI000D1DDFE0|nr:hypothetical protein [Staphylococcus xylosus]PTI27876.1 hypothetical protein BU115_03095 [Staphylococcus xylosus]HDP5827245.1 hypothetical protein [Staphylococcus aureus]
MAISVEKQRELLKAARKSNKRLSLPEKWKEEEKLNEQLGVYKKVKTKPFKPRKVSDEEMKKILVGNNK